MTLKVTSRTGWYITGEVQYLEKEMPDGSIEFIQLPIPDYKAKIARGMTDEEIFEVISWAHDTKTMKELVDEHLTRERLHQFACSAARP